MTQTADGPLGSGPLNRRAFIRFAASGMLVGTVGLPLLLEACGGTAAPASSAPTSVAASVAGVAASKPATASGTISVAASGTAASGAVSSTASGTGASGAAASGTAAGGLKLPTYIPFPGPKPDLMGTPEGIQDGYFSYPKTLVKSVPTPPGKGGDVTVFSNIPNPPTPLDQNPVWQQANKDLNVNLKFILAGTSAEAAQKLGALIAGNDLPDIMFLGPVSGASVNNLPDFLAAKCADLTPFLSGDAIKDFPNLANLPTYLWRTPGVVYNNKIYGIPVAQGRVGNALDTRQEMLDAAGAGPIKSADDFKRALQAVTRNNVFGLVDMLGFQLSPYLCAQIFGAPNNWKVDASGKFVKDWETDEFKAGLGFLHDLWTAGVISPNSLTYNNVTSGNDWAAGKSVFHYWQAGSMDWENALKQNSKSKTAFTLPFSADGKAKPQFFVGAGNFGASILKAGTPDRIREVLGVLNYAAAPFGSQEKLLTTYGKEGTDFTFDANGNPVISPKGYGNNPVAFAYMARGPAVAFTPTNSKDFAQMTHDSESVEIPAGVADPTTVLYSPSNGTIGATLKQTMADAINDVVAGRRPLTDWDGVVKDWLAKGGEKIRGEYQTAYAASAK